jgi:acyl-CoA dehydrogenase
VQSEPPDLARFRAEVRDWLEANCPAEMRQPMRSDTDICWGGRKFAFASDAQRMWMKRMGGRGWTVPAWPREYGGGGLSHKECQVLHEEMVSLGCRVPLQSFGIWMLGPALLTHGSEAQKRRHLPAIARGEVRWCQGYSEPNAGSDLASLATRAQVHEDHFVVTGQKIWTSYADMAEWMFCLVRTDLQSKQGGISFVLIDMDSPGVSTRPIRLISGKSPFCETFLDGVKVPRDNLVGQLHRGWTIAKDLLAHERESIGAIGDRYSPPAVGLHALEHLGADAKGRLDEPILRAEIARFEADEAAFRAWSGMFAEQKSAGQAHAAMPSALKYYGAELNKRRFELLMSAEGMSSLAWDAQATSGAGTARGWLRSKGNSIEGGTSEVQLNVIAKRILGLPGSNP